MEEGRREESEGDVNFEDGEKGHEPRNASGHWKLAKKTRVLLLP